MSNRFHNKFHSRNHHTNPTDRDGLYPDSAYDPIASREAPFKGEFYAQDDITTASSLSARYQVTAQAGVFHGDVTVKGNLEVLGDVTQLDTFVQTTSAVSITNQGTGPALTVTQTGQTPIAHFIDAEGDDIIIDNSGFLGLGTDAPNKKLTVVGDISAKRHPADPISYGYGNIFNDGNTTTQGRLTVYNQTHLLSSAFISNNLQVHTNTLNVSSRGDGYGRVGINTNIPTQELTVVGDAYITEDTTVGLNLNVLRNAYVAKDLYVNTKGLVALSGTNGNTKVGINVASPGVELAISGALSSTGNITTNGGLTADGSFYTKSSAKIDGQTTIGTINGTTNPDVSVKVLVHDSDSVVRFNYPNDVIWDTTAEFLTARNLTANTLPLYKSKFTLENSPISLNGTTININASLSANGNLTSTGTFKSTGDLSAADIFGNVIRAQTSNSDQWKSTYDSMRTLSAVWQESTGGGALTQIKATSGYWDRTYTVVAAGSASWNDLADGVVFRTGSIMTGPLSINPQENNYSSTALSLTGDLNLKGTLLIDTNAIAPVMSLSNPTGYGRLEVGGLSGGYIDFKSPFTDDFDIRVAHDQGTSYIATSGDLYIKTGTNLASLSTRAIFKANGRVGINTGNETPGTSLHVGGALTLGAETITSENFGAANVDAANLSGVYIQFSPGTATNDWAYLRQIGTNNNYHLAFDLHDDVVSSVGAGQAFSIRNIGAANGVNPDEVTTLLTVNTGNGSVRCGINNANPTDTLDVSGTAHVRGNLFINKSGNDPGTLIIGRQDSVLEGGQISLAEPSTNTAYWFLDAYGGATPRFRIFNNAGEALNITHDRRFGFLRTPDAGITFDVNGLSRITGGLIVSGGALRAQQGQPSPNNSTQNTAGYGFMDAANTGLFATNPQSLSLYTAGTPVITLENTGTRKVVIGGGESVDTSGNVYIGTTTTGAGEGGGYGRRHLVIKSSSTSSSGGLLELTDGAGGHGIVYRSNTTGLSSGGNLVVDSRMNDSGLFLVSRGSGAINFYTGGRAAFTGQSQINDYLTMSVSNQQVNINGGLFATPVGLAPRVKPAGWGGGVTTFDVYSDGGTIGIGAAGTGNPLATISNAGFGTFTGLQVNGNVNVTGTVITNAGAAVAADSIIAKEAIISTTTAGAAARIEIGGPLGGYIDLKSPSTDDSDFRISHWDSPTYGISNNLESRGIFYLYTGFQMFNMNPRIIVTQNLGRVGIGENSAPWMKMAIMGGLELFGETWNTNQPLSGRFVKPANSNIVTVTYPNHGVTTGQTIEVREIIYDGNLLSPVNTLANVTGIQESQYSNNWVAQTATFINSNAFQYTDSLATASTVMSGDIIFLKDEGNSVNRSNRTQTFINFKGAESANDFALLRQIGGNNQFHLALDMHDDGANTAAGTGQTFSVRNVGANVATSMFTIGTNLGGVRCGINTASPTDTFEVVGNTRLQGNVQINSSGTNYGTLFVGRQDNAMEGGQISLAESDTNTAYWFLDAYGGATPRFRIFNNAGEALNITNDRRVGIQRVPDAGIILDANGVIRGSQVIANNSGGQVIAGNDNNFAATEMSGPRGAYIDLRQTGGTVFATADNDFSLRLRAFDNSNDIEAPYRDLLIRSNTYGGANESRITLGSGNKVGIGPAITTPAATLHVGGDVIVASGGIRNNNITTALELYSGGSVNKRAILSLNGTGSSNTDGVTITTGSTITSLTINNSGRTALGYGGNALARLHIARSSTSTSLDNHIYLDGTINGTYGWFIDTQDFNAENVPFRISARRNGANTNHFVITNIEGNVGIGPNFTTTAPSARIHIRGGTSDGIKMSNNTRGVIFRNDDSDFYLLHTAANDPNGSWNSNRPFSFRFADGIVGLAYGGSAQCIVGNNTLLNSKTYKFQVNGEIYATGWIRTEGNQGWYSETWGGGWHMTDATWIRAFNNTSVAAKEFYASGGLVHIINESGESRLEIGASGNAYIDLKKPTGDDFDFRIAHNGNGVNTLECKGDLNIYTTVPDGNYNTLVNRLQISRNGAIAALGSEGSIAINNEGTGARFEVKSAGSGNSGHAAYMLFHRPDSHAVRFGLDTDNQLKVGGWSMQNNAYRIVHEGLSQVYLQKSVVKEVKVQSTTSGWYSKKITFDGTAADPTLASGTRDFNLLDLFPELIEFYAQSVKFSIMVQVIRTDVTNIYGDYVDGGLHTGNYTIGKYRNAQGYIGFYVNATSVSFNIPVTSGVVSGGLPYNYPQIILTAPTATANGYIGIRTRNHTNVPTSRYYYQTTITIDLELLN